MTSEHWTDEQMIDLLYGLEASDEHLEKCPECSGRALRLSQSHKIAAEPPEISDEFLAAQRRRIHERIGSPLRTWRPLPWALSAIVMLVFVLGMSLYRPAAPTPSRDDQFFAEISKMAQNPAPRAVQPIDALVQEDSEE